MKKKILLWKFNLQTRNVFMEVKYNNILKHGQIHLQMINKRNYSPGKFGSGTLPPNFGALGGVCVRESLGWRFLSCSLTVTIRLSFFGSRLLWFLLQNFCPGIALVLSDFGDGDLLLGFKARSLSWSLCFLISRWANFIAISIFSLDRELELTSKKIMLNLKSNHIHKLLKMLLSFKISNTAHFYWIHQIEACTFFSED